jgi:kynureninase
VNDPDIDFAVSTSLKWMCGTPGAGMLYVRPELIADCRPELRGWFSQDNPFNWDIGAFDYAPDIRRFDNGTPAILPAAATVPALTWHASIDRRALLHHNRLLCDVLIEGIDDMELPLLSPRNAQSRGGSLMVDLASQETASETLGILNAAGLSADIRGSVLRLSPGYQTTEDATRELVDVLGSSLKES